MLHLVDRGRQCSFAPSIYYFIFCSYLKPQLLTENISGVLVEMLHSIIG